MNEKIAIDKADITATFTVIGRTKKVKITSRDIRHIKNQEIAFLFM